MKLRLLTSGKSILLYLEVPVARACYVCHLQRLQKTPFATTAKDAVVHAHTPGLV